MHENEQSPEPAGESWLAQAETLIWALLDDAIAPTDLKRLERWMRDHEQVRLRYIRCVQLHTELHRHFRKTESPPQGEQLPASPVLGLLGDLHAAPEASPPVSD